jgi:glucokinase
MIVGVDVGGTKIVVGTLTENGQQLFGLSRQSTPVHAGPAGVIKRIVEMIKTSIAETQAALPTTEIEVVGVGIGSPGPLDTTRGVVILTPNLGWREVPLREKVSEAVGLPATLDNDANCAILGEAWRGAARRARYVVGVTIGTGVGGGIVIDGKIFHGASDAAGEIGHTTIDSTGRRCNCGNYGCLEAYASGPAIAARAVEGILAGEPTSLPEQVDGDLEAITAEVVYEAATKGDELALEVVRDTARFLGTGIANLINIFNPEIVVICGGVTAAGERLLGPLRKEVTRRAFKPAVDACSIVPGELTGTAGVYGAVAAFKAQTGGAD